MDVGLNFRHANVRRNNVHVAYMTVHVDYACLPCERSREK